MREFINDNIIITNNFNLDDINRKFLRYIKYKSQEPL